MFARQHRLTDKKIFTAIGRSGVWHRGKLFSARVILSRAGKGKITFVISKKTAKLATVRNRAKRRVRAAFEELLARSEFSPVLVAFHLLVVIHRALIDTSTLDIEKNAMTIMSGLKRAIPR